MENKYHFFWGSIFSNFTPSKFIVKEIEFNCGEQYFMFIKALSFTDFEIAKQILKENDPKVIKRLGRKVRGFDPVKWDEVKYTLIKAGLKCRFEQDKKAQKELLKHKCKIFVEASPYDRIWGIGYSK